MPRTLKWQTMPRSEWLLSKYVLVLLARIKLELFSIAIPHMTFYMAARNPYSDACDYVVSTLLAELHPNLFFFITNFLDGTLSLHLKLFKLFLLIKRNVIFTKGKPDNGYHPISNIWFYMTYFFYFSSKMWRKKYK